MISLSEQFGPEVLTCVKHGLGPLCFRFEGPRRKLINVTNISISMKNRISKSVYYYPDEAYLEEYRKALQSRL